MDDVERLRLRLMKLVADGRSGDRLPTVRALMRQFGLSQAKVQRELDALRDSGAIVSGVGRGTFIGHRPDEATMPPSPPPLPVRSVLFLRRSEGLRRGRLVLDALQHRFKADGCQTLEVTYSDARHACRVLRSLPRFDGCVIQSSFETIPVEMLAAARARADALAVDGAWLVGTDLDAVGFEWGEPVERAVVRLRQHGHRDIALATTSTPFLANDLGLRRYEGLRERGDPHVILHPPLLVAEPPHADYLAALTDAICAQRKPDGSLPFSAIIVWGVEAGSTLRAALAAGGIRTPEQLSIILLGRTDIPEEADGFFNLIGYRASDQCDGLYEAINKQWAGSQSRGTLRLLPVHEVPGFSISQHLPASPTGAGRSRSRREPPG
ncbi:substrate-binding domain-containing protein [Roseomonas haemaphysalidis]|nr:substrate-binding domain-containing protein [Roseomonas haemaphysalidis]